mmetsp:Transcript_111998/g.289418  ORF Transcript_111998/g.289418 Transcript_111998/m.289418 type:complete len:129 (-) Transcript_111998:4-390(-)
MDTHPAAPSTPLPPAPVIVPAPAVVTDPRSRLQAVKDTFGSFFMRKFSANHLDVPGTSGEMSSVLAVVVSVAFLGILVSLAIVMVVRRRRRYTPMELIEGCDDGQQLLAAGLEHPSRVRARTTSFATV